MKQTKQDRTHWHAAGLLVQINSGWRKSYGCDVCDLRVVTDTEQFQTTRCQKNICVLLEVETTATVRVEAEQKCGNSLAQPVSINEFGEKVADKTINRHIRMQ